MHLDDALAGLVLFIVGPLYANQLGPLDLVEEIEVCLLKAELKISKPYKFLCNDV